jgi:hypothetical protein
MTKQKGTENKGLTLEEVLRKYFLELGFYVVRGVKLFFQNDSEITDIDLWLYNKISPIIRHKTNVDAKYKARPKAMERIIWAKGVQQILHSDSCIVATTSTQNIIKEFGNKHGVIVLDGKFLSKIVDRFKGDNYRLSEEEFVFCIQSNKGDNIGKEWVESYFISKSILLEGADFNACNSLISDLHNCITNFLSLGQRQPAALRLTYLILSYLLISLDCILKDMIFLDKIERKEKLTNGLRFGDKGKETLEKLREVIGKDYYDILSSKAKELPTEIIAEYVSNVEVYSSLFDVAKKLETLAYNRTLVYPGKLEGSLQSIIAVFLDYFHINRKAYFDNSSPKNEKIDQAKQADLVLAQNDLFIKKTEK